MKKHRSTLAQKKQIQPNRTYGDLRQKHKAKIADWMFQSVCEYYQKHGEMPQGTAVSTITDKVYEKIVSTCIWVPYDEVYREFIAKLPRYETRIQESGLPDNPQASPNPPSISKEKGSNGKVCPACGRRMKQQFIGLKHCKCGMSWQRGEGFFERSNDMVFVLEQQKVGQKIKQRSVVRFKGE